MKYITKQGDMWDSIAFNELGSESLASEILKLNPQIQEIVFFGAGIEIELPEIDKNSQLSETKPPWE